MADAIAASLHNLSIFVLFALLTCEHILFRADLDHATAKRLLRIDIAYGITAGLVLVTGAVRVVWYGKGLDYYLHNGLFHAKVGLFLLIGVVKKNAILMIDLALELERDQHLSPQESIRRACLLRFRPIMMTTLAAMLGALPLLLGQAEGAEMRQPLGLAIVGGLVLSQLLTLYTTPVVYLYLDRLRHRVNRWRGVRSDAALETPL